MSDIKTYPINNEELSKCTLEELKHIRDSWVNEQKRIVSEMTCCEDALIRIHMEMIERGAYNTDDAIDSDKSA